ncbi:MFS transporter [Nocardia sp. MH4]|uniref:MFS transporter n=1 Tax=Nocardia TaxID=1817 RepID=UPI001C4F2A34|nr:MFS transporter [Nocardia sp. MH4]MBW0274431.1 MFS transporter [Nocardia sp. MH4]
MIEIVRSFGSYNKVTRMLMINQFAINLGFYMLMPYLAGYLSGSLGLAAWTVGLVLGVRNFSQQGMFLIGGTLADRLGYKPLIVAGCLLRTAGFGLLAVVETLPALLIASAATGFAGALFNPAVRAYLAAEAGERRVPAFAMFNVFYQAGILAGPLVGIALLALDFRVTAAAAAGVFAVLTIGQLAALPSGRGKPVIDRVSVWKDWASITSNRAFMWFAVAMTGSYVLSFQVYLALPLHAEYISDGAAAPLVAALFVINATVAVAGQLRITRWFEARFGSRLGLVVGVGTLAAAFLPLLLVPDPGRFGPAAAIIALLVSAAILAVASVAVFPFEMDTIVSLSGGRLVATHYGFYNTIVGIGILLGNLGTGALLGAAHRAGLDALAWAGLIVIGAITTTALGLLNRSGALGRAESHTKPLIST